jgi:hypothetical membrane protein
MPLQVFISLFLACTGIFSEHSELFFVVSAWLPQHRYLVDLE